MEVFIALATLILLEIVLGIDNIIFISIITARLPDHQQKKGRRVGLLLAMVMRLVLLTVISFILKLQSDLFTVFSMDISGKDLILILGGLFLLYKSVVEIYDKTERKEADTSKNVVVSNFANAIGQILLLDLVFSIDSIITAVGMVDELWIMYAAVIISVAVMWFASEQVSSFINKHPSFKMLALSFLLLIGISLIGEGLELHIPKGYIYFSMAFALLVDVLQMRMHKSKSNQMQNHIREKLKED